MKPSGSWTQKPWLNAIIRMLPSKIRHLEYSKVSMPATCGGCFVRLRPAKTFLVVFSGIEEDEEKGKAHWEAHYTFSQTGRACSQHH